ncbi:enolase C-terminal domain-like protein [Flavobacterium capsici]|uniref:Enolase C-terminal domain-like protein n=1 Tax=Flavobacterium capsici TaxID=3075618 RepID=A0AA96EUG1_9FLAO|nr:MULTISPECIES: enolase C-terminal domain-like protein [unclassified Flavobacterium]WNM18904.1 enolase C-terminal domain-like protein [Flavobacterium sp. PMR2A8]WNM22954.1 enolase C-terminal domain-like protein [Flavobacterium sp. PMTSA4]
MKIQWQIVKFKLKETFVIAYGNYNNREALIISLEHQGCRGYGECTSIDYYNINLSEFESVLQKVKFQIESHKIVEPTDFYAFLLKLNLPSFLRSALDCAYWDLFGKLEKKSFLELNQINSSQLPESSLTISIDSIENQIKKINESNWNYFKVKCNSLNKNSVFNYFETNKKIALDSNGSFTNEDCFWLENNEETSKFLYLEQPMGKENFASLSNSNFANWMADEDCQASEDLEKLQSHYKSINIKLVKCGGLTPALSMIKDARKQNFKVMIGCMTESTIGISAGAVLSPLCDFADLDGATLIENDIAKGSQIENGKIKLSLNFGLGIQLI